MRPFFVLVFMSCHVVALNRSPIFFSFFERMDTYRESGVVAVGSAGVPTWRWVRLFRRLMKGFGGVAPWYDFKQNLLTHCDKASPASIPSWNVSCHVSIIQNGRVHRNRNFPGIATSLVWNNNTGCPISKCLIGRRQCRSTNALCHPWLCSSWLMLFMRCSPSSSNWSRRCCLDSNSGKRSLIWRRRLGTWNSMGMTDSNLNASRYSSWMLCNRPTLHMKFVVPVGSIVVDELLKAIL